MKTIAAQKLAAAIIIQAVKDLPNADNPKRHDRKIYNRKELDKFFKSEWFVDLCEFTNIDRRSIIKYIEGGKTE